MKALHCRVEDGLVAEGPKPLPRAWRNVSGLNLLDEKSLAAHGWLPYRREDDGAAEGEVQDRVERRVGEAVVVDRVLYRARTAEEIAAAAATAWADVRSERDRRMAALDWRVLRHQRELRLGLDPTEDIAELDRLMQALADITGQPDPHEIVWPDQDEPADA